MIDWKIQSHAHSCQACGVAFQDGASYHTLLYKGEGGYERFDVCPACWRDNYAEGGRRKKGFISHWKGLYRVPPPPPPEPLQKETAETLLRKLVTLDEPRYVAAAYILAAMLERKRVLKVKAEDFRDGQRVTIYEHPKSGDLFTIPDPGLRLDQLQSVQEQVSDLLEHGLPAEVDPGGSGHGGELEGEDGQPVEGEAPERSEGADEVASKGPETPEPSADAVCGG